MRLEHDIQLSGQETIRTMGDTIAQGYKGHNNNKDEH
jgi:hypothetical protein